MITVPTSRYGCPWTLPSADVAGRGLRERIVDVVILGTARRPSQTSTATVVSVRIMAVKVASLEVRCVLLVHGERIFLLFTSIAVSSFLATWSSRMLNGSKRQSCCDRMCPVTLAADLRGTDESISSFTKTSWNAWLYGALPQATVLPSYLHIKIFTPEW